MDWKKNRLTIAGVLLVALGGLAIWTVQKNKQQPEKTKDVEVTLPEVDKAKVDELEIHQQGKPAVRVAKKSGKWRVVQPVDAEADQSTVDAALDRLDELEVVGVAATKKANHAVLEVDDQKGIRVIPRASGKVLFDVVLGTYRGGNTMVRESGKERVLSVRGSLKYAFDKEVKDWRDRRIVEVEAAKVRGAVIESKNGTFKFVRDGETWKPQKGQKAIERFDGEKVQSLVSSLSQLRATDFAEKSVTRDAAGLATPAATITLTMGSAPAATQDAGTPKADAGVAATESTLVLRLGTAGPGGDDFYLEREGTSQIFLVSKYLAERMQADAKAFQAPEPSKTDAGTEMPAMPPSDPSGMMGPGGGQIPPEVMQQLQQQLQQQGHP